MGAVLGAGVNLLLNGPKGELVELHPGDKVPDWAKDKVGDHVFEDVDGADADDAGDDDSDGPPPQSGKGSGKDAWHAYAAAKGVTVADDASREDVIAACTAANVATE